MKKYFVREESFGYTFFDKRKLRHEFLAKTELKKVLRNRGVSAKEVELIKARRKEYRKDIIYSPIRIYYELTLGCNLRCRYCFNSSGIPRKNELTTKEVMQSLDHLRQSNVLDLRFTGGEITCRSDWFDILQYAKNLGFAISCNINAAYHDDTVSEKFAQLDLDQVTVSIDGIKEHHDLNRGVGSFDRTIKNLAGLHRGGVRLRINTLVNKYSMHDIEYMLDLAAKYTDEINFFTIVFIGRGAELETVEGVTVEDHFKMSVALHKLKPKYPQLRVLHFAEVSRKTSVDKSLGEKFGLRVGPPSGTTTFNLLSDGSYCCGGYAPYIDPSLILGNVRTDDLVDVWQKSQKLEQIRDDGRLLILFCDRCDEFTNGRCQGSKYETELNRFVQPGIKNPTCIYSDSPSLLNITKKL
ncbi:MAG: radical SAM protein [Patescibacteria group bacterium]|jgi:MoaA/NifB/PqqE/SkfB family radical SAM enzyme